MNCVSLYYADKKLDPAAGFRMNVVQVVWIVLGCGSVRSVGVLVASDGVIEWMMEQKGVPCVTSRHVSKMSDGGRLTAAATRGAE